MIQYTKFTPTNNDLIIELTEAGKEIAGEFLERLETENYHSLWWELNEYNFCNGWYEVRPETIAALTDSPIIADGIIDEETTSEEFNNINVYWFPNYIVIDELRELLAGNKVEFTLAP